MTSTGSIFDLEPLRALQIAARAAAELPQGLQEGWHQSPVSPMNLLKVFAPVRLRPGYVLEAWLFYSHGNGNGAVYAIPENRRGGQPAFESVFDSIVPPPGGVLNFMSLLEGDGTPWSYLCASLLGRELSEFGAQWHGCNWSTHRLLGADPWRMPRPQELDEPNDWPSADDNQWTWTEPRPRDWRPMVHVAEKGVLVTFYSFTTLGQEQIVRHADSYALSRYEAESAETVIATGKSGYVF